MPLYCYQTEDGEIVERMYSAGRAPATITVNGCTAHRSYQAEHSPHNRGVNPWPMWSIAGGVHPSQVAEATQVLAEAGVKAEFNEHGDVKWESKGHREAYIRARRWTDKS